MSKNSEHSVKIVWDDPSQEVAYPRRNFNSLNQRVIRRKRLIKWITGVTTSIVVLGIYLMVSLSHKSNTTPETPVNQGTTGPKLNTEQPYEWSVIDSIEHNKSNLSIPDKQNPSTEKDAVPVNESVENMEETEVVESENEIALTPEDSIQFNDQIVLEEESLTSNSPIVESPVKSFVPSEFVRAYPTVGYDSLYRYLTEYINKELFGSNNAEDTLKISFAIEIDGRPSGIKLSINTSDSVFMKIEEVVQNMPAWKPATADGQPIKTRFRLPLIIQSKTIKIE